MSQRFDEYLARARDVMALLGVPLGHRGALLTKLFQRKLQRGFRRSPEVARLEAA